MQKLPYHHIFWKTPFETVQKISQNPDQVQKAKLAIKKFDLPVNRFDLPDKSEDTGQQGKQAKIQAPFFQIFSYYILLIREGEIQLENIRNQQLQHFIGNYTKKVVPQRINLALTEFEDLTGKDFIKALRKYILKLIPDIPQDGKIPNGYDAMIDYRYQKIDKVKPQNTRAQFTNLRAAIERLLPLPQE